MPRQRVGEWRREPGLDWIYGDDADEAYAYEHSSGEITLYVYGDDGEWSVVGSSDAYNQIFQGDLVGPGPLGRGEALQRAYAYMTDNPHGGRYRRKGDFDFTGGGA